MRKLLNKVMGITPEAPYCGCTYIDIAACIAGCGSMGKSKVNERDCATGDICGTYYVCGC